MKFYEAIIRECVSIPKLLINKIFNYDNLFFHLMQDISISTRIVLVRGGKLELGKVIHTRRNVEFNISDGGIVKIGDRTCFNNGDMIVCKNKIEIGENCSFGPNVLLYDHDHDFSKKNGLRSSKYLSKPIIIGNNVWIGANTIILKGTVIGDNCVVGAGSVVNGVYPDNSVIVQKRVTEIRKYSFSDMESNR